MASYLNLGDDERLNAKVDEKAKDLFKVRKGKPQLQVNKCPKKISEDGKEIVCVESDRDIKNLFELKDVRSVFELKTLRNESKDSSQFFIIRQEHTYTTLDISRELFEDLLLMYGVFSHFWRVAFTFGRKSEQNEFAFPDIRTKWSPAPESNANEIHESACVLRRVELHNRELEDGQSPWSIRQTGVYHKLSAPADPRDSPEAHSTSPAQKCNPTFILIAPSQNFETQLSQSLELSMSDSRAIGPWNIYRLLFVESLGGWLDYMTWLEESLKEQSRGIIYAKVGAEKENLSPLTNFTINFIDRQNLKITEDYVIDLQAILPTLLSTIMGIRVQCRKWCERHHGKRSHKCDCDQVLEEFDEHIREAEGYVKRAEALRERARSTTQLLSDLLSYEDAIQLKDVASQTQQESKSMLFLTVRSTKDAAAVKILTIISLIYLPSTIVANFFSTQFVHTDDNGNLAVSGNTWILAACVIPLTAITIALWWTWVHWTSLEESKTSEQPYIQKIIRYNSFKSLLSSKRGQRPPDLERGIVPRNFGAGTWSTTATTAVTGKSEEN